MPEEHADEITGHLVRTVRHEGWKGVENGELLRRSVSHFDVFLTVDKRIERNVRITGQLAVITIRCRSNRLQDLRPLVPAILKALKDLRPGTFVRVPP